MKKFFSNVKARKARTGIAAICLQVALLTLVAVGCSSAVDNSAANDKVSVSATISVIGDLVKEVGGERVEVKSIVEPGADAHTFQPRPSDVEKVSEARLVFENGLGLEAWLDDLVKSAGGDGVKVVELSRGMDTVGGNPHLWLDVSNAELYVARIRDALIEADPDGAETYRANAKAYLSELEKLDAYIKDQARSIPEGRRKLVTLHDAFPYFARAYGFELIGVILENPNAEPSGREIAEVVREIERQDVPAVFAEPQFNASLADTISREANVEVYEIYSDTLVDEKGAGSYEAMMRTDIDRIKEGLNGR